MMKRLFLTLILTFTVGMLASAIAFEGLDTLDVGADAMADAGEVDAETALTSEAAMVDNLMMSQSLEAEQAQALDDAFTDSPDVELSEVDSPDVGTTVNLRMAAVAAAAQEAAVLASDTSEPTGDSDTAADAHPNSEMIGSFEAVQAVMGDMQEHVFQGMSEEAQAEFGGDVAAMQQNFQAMASYMENMMGGTGEGSEEGVETEDMDFSGDPSMGFEAQGGAEAMPEAAMVHMNDLGSMIGAAMNGMSPEDFEQNMETMMEMRSDFMAQMSAKGMMNPEMMDHDADMSGTEGTMPGEDGMMHGQNMATGAFPMAGPLPDMSQMMTANPEMMAQMDHSGMHMDNAQFDPGSMNLSSFDVSQVLDQSGIDPSTLSGDLAAQIASQVNQDFSYDQLPENVQAGIQAANSVVTGVKNHYVANGNSQTGTFAATLDIAEVAGQAEVHYAVTSNSGHDSLGAHKDINITDVHPNSPGHNDSVDFVNSVQTATSQDITHISVTTQ